MPFHNSVVVKKFEVTSTKEMVKNVKEKSLVDVQKMFQRKGGPTSEMKSKQAMKQRNDKINACKYPTEQMSFSVLNVEELLQSPYGQIMSSLWRGCENRENLIRHGSKFHHQLKGLLINGAEFTLPNGEREEMNVIPIMCADLGYMKEILGKCLSTCKYDCYYCKKPLKEWDSQKVSTAEPLSTREMIASGTQGETLLGVNPDHKLREFTEFQHYGQYAAPLFSGFDILTMPPCGLHMILAHHRYLWSFLSDVIQRRNQGNLISTGSKKIGCTYLAFQFDAYLKSKKTNIMMEVPH